MKYCGVDSVTGSSRSSTEDLGFVLDLGRLDWDDIAMALREFVSNAIDRSIRETGDWSGVTVEVGGDPVEIIDSIRNEVRDIKERQS